MRRLVATCFAMVFFATSLHAQSSCTEMELDDAVAHAGELTTLLKIANFRADVAYMGEVALELEQFLETCGTEESGRLALVCDYDCHLQLGRYRLFVAAQLPLLSSASGINRNDSPLSPQAAQDTAREGLLVVERGLRLLARQQGGGEGDAAEASYRTFTRQLIALSSLKIQLLMTTGDVWYQTVSEARLKQLDFLIGEALSTTTGREGTDPPNLTKAYTNYEAALWTLIELKTDIPGDASYDDLRADILLIESDLQDRVGSVKRGYLFLNIDPLQFTTIPFEDLQNRLAETKRQLDVIENRVEAIVERWHANRFGEATRALDEERTIRSQEINLIAHRIGKIEHEAQIFANTVQQEINAVDAERDTFGFRQQIRNLEITLATRIAEFENQRRQLGQRRELDLLVLSKEAEIERRNELRWLLSWEMTQMNLDLQISSIETQITEYERQSARNTNQSQQLARQRQILETQIANSEAGIEQANAKIATIETRRTDLFAGRRAVAREDICGIEAQLALIGETADTPFAPLLADEAPCDVPTPEFTRNQYVGLMCGEGDEVGLRQKIIDQRIQARAFVMKCVVGDADFSDLSEMIPDSLIPSAAETIEPIVELPPELDDVDCGSFTQTETDFARDLYQAEKELLEKKAADFADAIDQMEGHILAVELWAGIFDGSVIALQTGLAIAEASSAAMASVPVTTVAVAGLASGTYVEVDVSRPARESVSAARALLDGFIQIGKVTQQTMIQVQAMQRQLESVRRANSQIDYQKALKSVALHNTHFQLAGRLAQGRDDIRELVLQNSIAAVECDSQELGIDEQVARLKANHNRLLASLALQAQENDLLSFEIATQERQITRHQNEIAILNLDLEKLALSEQQLSEDNDRIASLVAAAEGRLDRVRRAQSTVLGLANESMAATNVINELRDRQQAQMLALSDAELAFVEQRISTETANTEVLVAGLNDAIDLGLKSRELQGQILEFQGEVLEEVSGQQDELMELVSQIDDPETRRNLFIANQETLSELMKGVPEYLVSKRRALENANRLLHLMRRRFAVVNATLGETDSIPQTYVRNATQLGALVDDIVNARFFDERQINIDVAQIVVPANSGFARRLALTETVEFEVSPFAATEELMRESGFFAVWAPNKFTDRRNMTLIDAFVGTQYQCTGAQWNRFALAHLGTGYVFRPIAEGSTEVSADILVGPERLSLQTFFNLADSQDEVNRIIRYWLQDRFQVRRFPRPNGPPNDTTSILPFLGSPVMGSYRVTLQPSDCPFDGAVFTLYFIFASEP